MRRGRCGGAGILLVAAQAAGFGRGIEKNLYVGVGEDDGADVAAFHDDTAFTAEVALEVDEPGANGGVNADTGGSLGDVGVANAFGDVFAVEEDAVACAIRAEDDFGIVREAFEGRGVVEVVIAQDGLEREGAIHGAGFKIEQAEMLREMAGDGALAGSSRAVDGDDGTACHSELSSLLRFLRGLPGGAPGLRKFLRGRAPGREDAPPRGGPPGRKVRFAPARARGRLAKSPGPRLAVPKLGRGLPVPDLAASNLPGLWAPALRGPAENFAGPNLPGPDRGAPERGGPDLGGPDLLKPGLLNPGLPKPGLWGPNLPGPDRPVLGRPEAGLPGPGLLGPDRGVAGRPARSAASKRGMPGPGRRNFCGGASGPDGAVRLGGRRPPS